MARHSFRTCKVCSILHELGEWPEACLAHFGEPTAAGPQIISDTIEPFLSHASKTVFSSKSLYRADLRARGMVEVGNENVQQRRVEAPPVRGALRDAVRSLGG